MSDFAYPKALLTEIDVDSYISFRNIENKKTIYGKLGIVNCTEATLLNHRILLLVMSIPVLAGCQQNKCAINVKQENEIRPTVGLKIKHGIKVVYQIKTDDKKEGVGAGLYYVKKLIDTYQDLNISENDRDVHAVFHGDAGYWMLKDKPYENETNSSVNPNKKIIDELLASGVKLELCASTMKSHNWTKEDIVEGITIVVGAYPRIIDLQMRGYGYIRF